MLLMMLLVTETARAEHEDTGCLQGVKDAVQDPDKRLPHWTCRKLQRPCNDTISQLEGVTCNNGRVYKLSFPGFGLTGRVSPYFSSCTNLQTLDLSANGLSGQIPLELQSMENPVVLNLSVNDLTGPIPSQLALCINLNVIDLHNNKLTGGILPELGLHNRLQGAIPPSLVNRSGMLPHFNVSSFQGIKDLYGYPLPLPKTHGLSVIAIVGIGLSSGFLSIIVSFTAVCIWLWITEQGSAAEEGKISQLMPDY